MVSDVPPGGKPVMMRAVSKAAWAWARVARVPSRAVVAVDCSSARRESVMGGISVGVGCGARKHRAAHTGCTAGKPEPKTGSRCAIRR
jgi:hypothetical protein